MATAYRWSEEVPEGRERNAAGRPSQHTGLKARRYTANLTVFQGTKKRKSPLLESYTVKRIDNSRLVRRVEPVKLRNYYKTVALGGFIALFFMCYVYQHFRCIDLSFQLEDLKAKQMQAQALNSEMKLEIATLRDPRRIDVIARHQLGLTQPLAVQMREYGALDGAQVAAAQYGKGSQ